MLGDPAVGKTSLVQRFVHHSFGGHYKITMGLDLSIKEVNFPEETVRMQLWDMGGQAAFKALRSRFYTGTRAAIMVYDATRPQTFQNLNTWLEELQTNSQTSVPFVVLGNKSDLLDFAAVNDEDINGWCVKNNAIAAWQTSAKTGNNVEEAFKILATVILEEILKEEEERDEQPVKAVEFQVPPPLPRREPEKC